MPTLTYTYEILDPVTITSLGVSGIVYDVRRGNNSSVPLYLVAYVVGGVVKTGWFPQNWLAANE